MPPTTVPTSPPIAVTSPGQLAGLVQDCTNTGTPIIDYGIAHAGLGNPPPRDHIKLQLRDTTLEHHERDFVVSAAAGITMGQLQAVLRQANQFVPIDADDDLTLGEVILHHVYGPLRVGYGSVRDLLLGLRYIDGLGRDIHVGGRTVKNVAGYDLTRFMVGSLGELGLVYNATFRTSAIPQSVLAVSVHLNNPGQIDHAMTDLLVADAAPAEASLHIPASNEFTMLPTEAASQSPASSCLQREKMIPNGYIDTQDNTPNHGTILTLAYHGHPDGCQAQLDALNQFVARVGAMRIVNTQQRTWAQHTVEKAGGRHWRRRSPALVKVIVPPSATGASCQTLSQWGPKNNTPLCIDALPAHGCLFVGGNLDAQAAFRLDQVIDQVITPVAGLRAWHASPTGPPGPTGAQPIAPFAPAQPDWPLLTQLKHKLDPMGLFNPGRFLPVGRPTQ